MTRYCVIARSDHHIMPWNSLQHVNLLTMLKLDSTLPTLTSATTHHSFAMYSADTQINLPTGLCFTAMLKGYGLYSFETQPTAMGV
jgi:hypothetical protein